MKLIHCADIHLGAPLKQNLSKEHSRERKNELLYTFQAMVEYGQKNQVDAILISGDLFDGQVVPNKVGLVVRECIENAPQIEFFYLRGNHDANDYFGWKEKCPENLHLFCDEWKSYLCKDVVISGIEITDRNKDSMYEALQLREEDHNIVMLHGYEEISMKRLKNRGIDYLALGHLHCYQEGKIDERGQFCYPGCLEGRGFDECGEKGFVLITMKNGFFEKEFIPFAKRQIHEVEVDVSGVTAYTEMENRLKDALADVLEQDLVRVKAIGEVPLEWGIDLGYFQQKYGEEYYFFEIKDRTKLQIDRECFAYDMSLKGEFIRLCMEQNLPEEERKRIMELGIRALMEEEL